MTVQWFEDALRPATVMADLTGHVPEFMDGRLVLLGCRISRIRSVPKQNSWKAVYELDVREAKTGREWTCVANGTLTPPDLALPHVERAAFGLEGWDWTAPGLGLHLTALAEDDALPGLAVSTDPDEGRLLLQRSLQSHGTLHPDARITGFAPTVLTHKAGVRATVLCRLRYDSAGPGGPSAVVVKVHHDEQGKRAFDAMRTLIEAIGDTGAGVRLARPLAFVPGLRLSIQEYVEHRCTLKDLFHDHIDGTPDQWAALLDATRATATGLAALHGSDCPLGEPVTWDEELATLRRKLAKLTSVVPQLAPAIGSVPDRLVAAAAKAPPDPLAPAHHSFRPAQVLLLADSGVAFIDFDKFCQAEPASDLALFTAKLQHMGANKVGPEAPGGTRAPRVAQLRESFLAEYLRHFPISMDRVRLWEALELMSLVLSAAKKVNVTWMERCQQLLEEHLDSCGW